MKPISSIHLIVLLAIVSSHIFLQKGLAQTPLQVALGSDTIYVCAHENFELIPQVSGGQSPYHYLWSDSSTQAHINYLPADGDSLLIWLEVTDGQQQNVRDTTLLIAFGNCIWPGDMNGDAAANHVDMLEWGRAVGYTGPQRPNAHTNWIGQAGPSWGHSLPGGHDFAYADADGDGWIHQLDLLAIEQNYVRVTPDSGFSSTGGGIVQFNFPNDSTTAAGDTLRIPLYLGNTTQTADSVYGFACSILYDPSMIVPGSVTIDADSSWLGTEGLDMVMMYKDFHQDGQLDVALTRINHQPRSGQGKLFDLVITIDNISGKNENAFTLTLKAQGAQWVNASGNTQGLPSRSLSLDIFSEVPAGRPEPYPGGIAIYPNPVTSRLIIQPDTQAIERIQLIDLTGRVLREESQTRDRAFSWNVGDIQSGMYLLVLQDAAGILRSEKIQINK